MNVPMAPQSQKYSVPATNSLYPISINRETAALAASLLVERETDRDGAPLLPVLPTPSQRELLTRRGRELATHLMPGKVTALALVLNEMFLSMGAAGGEEQANKRTTQYVTVLQHLPLWAVKRACARFSRGDVTADELGERSFSRGFPPSTAHLHLVAARIIQHFREEQADIREVLRARLAYAPPPEVQKKIADGFEALKVTLQKIPAKETPHDRAYRERGEYLDRKAGRVPAPARRDLAPSPALLNLIAEQDARPVPPKPKHADESR